MKLIQQYTDSFEAENLSSRIRRAGVMTVVTSKKSHNLSSSRTGAIKVGLWVVFDDQYEDAIQLLKNRKHRPERIITHVEMKKLEKAANDHYSLLGKKIFEKAATIIFSSVIMALVIYVAMGLINGE